MTEDAKPKALSVADEATRLLDDGTRFAADLTDAEIKRYAVEELIDPGPDKSEHFINGAWAILSGDDPRVLQVARKQRKHRLGLLRSTPISGWRN